VDVTELARSLLEPIPAHRLLGIEVLHAADGVGVVALVTSDAVTNVIGSLHSSGLTALADAAGLAAVIGASEAADSFRGVVPLGAAATLEFRAPARGRLVAACTLDPAARQALAPVLSGWRDRVKIATVADITDKAGTLTCRGTFEWSIRRVSPAPAA
jgi:acyl-coenzyme A thioesterase PaaI-like protein